MLVFPKYYYGRIQNNRLVWAELVNFREKCPIAEDNRREFAGIFW